MKIGTQNTLRTTPQLPTTKTASPQSRSFQFSDGFESVGSQQNDFLGSSFSFSGPMHSPSTRNTGNFTMHQLMGTGPKDLRSSVETSLFDQEVGSGKGFEFLRFGPPLDFDGLVPLKLPQNYAFLTDGDSNAVRVDYPQRTAFVDQANNAFFLQVTDQMSTGKEHWFGPIPLKK